MDPQLLRPVAAVAAATVQAAGPRGVVYDSSNRQEQLLRLAVRRQLQQEQRQQQHLKQHQVRKDSPEEQRDTLLDEQQQCGHQKEPQYNLEQWQELRQPHPEPLLKCAFSRTEGVMVEQSSFTAVVGSGSVSTANSGSERSSRNASDDEATIVRKRPELQKKWAVGELVYNEGGLRKIPNLSMAQKFTHENLEPLREQRWQTGPREDTEQQPQQRHGKDHEGQQQQQLCSQMQQQQQPQELTQQHCGPQDPRHHLQQQQQQLNVSTERTPTGKHLPPYAEEIGLGLHVGSAFLGRRHVHPSTELPPLPPRFAHTADAVPPEQGLFHAMYETGYPGGPVRPARKKVQHPTPRRTFSSSVPASASSASKDRVRSRAGRTYLNSRITEVKSFAGTLEEYLLFRRQQAERKEAVAAAAAAAHSGSSGVRAIGPPNQHLIERMKASTICNGHRRAASAGRQDFTGITATAHSSRSSSRGASATPRCKDNERMQQFPVWERNVAVQQRQRRTAHGIFQQLSKRISESSQQGSNMITGGICATSGDGPGDATAAKNRNRTSKGQNPMLQLRTPTGNNSPLRVARGDDKTEEGAEDERIEVRLSNSSAQRPRRRDISCSQTQESQTDQNSGFSRGDTRKRASATSADNQQEHARREGSVPCNGKREEAAAAGGDAKDTDEHNTDEQKTRGRGRKFIPLEMRNGEILWPTDRPIIPLNAWIFQNFSSDEPLDPQNWVHLPNVGPAISPAISALQSPQSEHPPTRPPISCSTAPLVRSPLVAEARLTEPVKLPPIKLSIGCEVPRFIIQTSTLPEMCTQTEMPPNSSAPTIHGEKIRSRSSSGRLGGAPAARLKSVYTQFYKQTHVRHRPTNFEGIVVRAEDAGRVLLVRSKDGHLRKLHREECEAVGFMCSSAPPPERLLTDAAHVHSTHLLSASSGSLPETEACSSPGSAGVPAVRGSAHLRNATFCVSPAASSARKPPLPPKRDHLRQTTRQGTHVQKHAPGGQMLGATVPECPALPRHHNEAKRAFLNIYGSLLKPGPAAPSPLLERNEEACNRSDNEQTQKLALQQVPDLQEVIKLAQQHASATMPNTVALKNMATIPAIRAVDSQVTVEAIRVKRYTLEGQEEENLLPVFSADTSTQNNRASSIASAAARPAATKDERGAPPDAVGLLLQEHDARQVLKKREEQLATDEVIYAQDAPEATRARGIAPPTIVKESLVIPPKEDELLYYPQQAPGIMPPLYQCNCKWIEVVVLPPPPPSILLCLIWVPVTTMLLQDLSKTGKFQTTGYRAPAWPKGSDISSASTETPDMQHVNVEDHRRTGEGQERAAANDSLLLDAEGPAWFSDLKAQFRNKLLHQYLQTGSMEAAALAISSGGYTPLSFTASYPHLIQRKQAKVLRDELRHMQFAPVGQNKPL